MNRWFWIELRNGNEELVAGEVERDRKMARKTPRATGWRPAKSHCCDICNARGPWTADWTWFGSYKEMDEGTPITRLCSKACRDAWREMSKEAGMAPGTRSRWAHDPNEPIRDKNERAAKWQRKWSAGREMRAHRAFPMPNWPTTRSGPGWCRWCGEEIVDLSGKRKDQRSHNRTWHRRRYGDKRDCLHEWALHTDIDAQFWHLVARDGPGCALSGRGSGKWIAAHTWHDAAEQKGITWLRWSEKLEVDHVIALWKVAHLPDEERRRYFGPDNLWLLSETAHRGKTAREAADRAQTRR